MKTATLDAFAGSHRVVRSFAFIDLCGFTDFVDANGDQAAVAELRHLRSTVREIAPLCGVRVDKWLGDGVMLVGVEVEPVVAAMVAIEEQSRGSRHLALRAGMATGEVILLEGDDYVGRAVNLAARLCDQAAPGQLLGAEERLVLPDGVEIVERFEIPIRGMADSVQVVAIAATGSKTFGGPPQRPAAVGSLVEGSATLIRRLRTGRAEER